MIKKPIAIGCSDIHLSETPPATRQDEPNWYESQRLALRFIVEQAMDRHIPLIMAGDLFHKAKSTPSMEILAMTELRRAPQLFMIPGQHDLPNHSLELVNKSSYGVVCSSLSLSDAPKYMVDDVLVELYPYGSLKRPCRKKIPAIAVLHDLIWSKEIPYPGAPEEGNVKELVKAMPGYRFIVAGDNHKGFTCQLGGTTIVNCGGMMRRTADQEDYKPRCYVLYTDGEVEPIYLPIDKDVFSREHRDMQVERDARVEAFVNRLQNIEVELSFEKNMDRFIKKNKVKEEVASIIRGAMNGE